MKKLYESPKMYAETFVANQYVAACGDTTTIIPPMQVRCQSDGHQNTAKDTIFLDSNTSCVGKYNASLKDDDCHSQLSHMGKRSYGIGYVKGSWNETEDWFTENAGDTIAYKGYFKQGGHRHLFYATTEQAELFQGS